MHEKYSKQKKRSIQCQDMITIVIGFSTRTAKARKTG